MKTLGGKHSYHIDERIEYSLVKREFLTGFRKRKLARQEAGKAKALERERQSRLEARREVAIHL